MINLSISELITMLVAVVGGFKAIEWILLKLFAGHDKTKKIDTNAEELDKYKTLNEKDKEEINERLDKIEKSVASAHNYAQDNLNKIKKEIVDTITYHREEYLEGIKEVKQSITEMSSVYQQTVAIIDLKISQLNTSVEKHNQVVERTYSLEKAIGILENRESVSEHRIDDLEKEK